MLPAPGDAGVAAVLNAGAAAVDYLDLKLEVEVFSFESVEGDVAVADRFFFGGFADDGSVFYAPHRGVADPVFETYAGEDLLIAVVILPVDWVGLVKAAAAVGAFVRRWRGCWGIGFAGVGLSGGCQA